MSVRRCDYCHTTYVQWLTCRDGRRRLFEATPVPVDQLPDRSDGWVPGRTTLKGRERVALARLDHVSRGKADAAVRAMVLHRCPEYQRLHNAVFDDASG